MIYTKRADLLEAAAKSIRMQEAEKVEPVCKLDGDIITIKNCNFANFKNYLYEFPLAIVEGKPVWVGSELYNDDGDIFTVKGLDAHTPRPAFSSIDGLYGCTIEDASWNPTTPKPEIPEGFMKKEGFMAEIKYQSGWDVPQTPGLVVIPRDKLKTIADLVKQLGEVLKD